jgi:hypothetical protein
MPWTDFGDAGAVVGAVVAAAFGFRHVLSKLNLTTTSDSANQTLILNLQADRDQWKKTYNRVDKLYQAQRDANVLLRTQVLMMRQMLLSKGMTEQELIAIGAILPPEPEKDKEDDE